MDFSQVLLITDMDGTLLSSVGEEAYLSKTNRNKIESFINSGGMFSVASGRNLQNVYSALDGLEVNFPYTLVNGALTVGCKHSKIIASQSVNESFLKEAIKYYKANENLTLIIANEYKMYALSKNTTQDHNHGFKWEIIDESHVDQIKPMKLAFAFDSVYSNRIYSELKQLPFANTVQMVKSQPYFIEIVDQSASKGNAIKQSVETMNLKDKTIICVGDYLNDESMLEYADYAYVTSNAHEELKKKFKVLFSSHDDDIMVEMLNIISDL